MKFVRISSLVIGLGMIVQWLFFLLTNNVPEIRTAPVSISFHITIELLTATILLSIFFLLRKPTEGKKYLAVYGQGMLGYTVVNSAGYFAQSGDWIFLIMFSILLCVSFINTLRLLRGER